MKKSSFLLLTFWGTSLTSNGHEANLLTKVENITISYDGKKVKAKKLVVCSKIPMDLDRVWANVKTTELLVFVTKGYTRLSPIEGAFPKCWKTGDTVSTKTKIFGIIPFGGIRNIYVETISENDHFIQTREWDNSVKVWDHKISLINSEDRMTIYKDEIVIYGGWMTGVITSFAKMFYKNRQKRWQIVAKENLIF